jgi:hypothetical protein
VFLFFNFVISDAPRPGTGTPVTIDGHQLYQSAARADLCSYVSVQGTTADGHYEQLAAIATVRPSETAPPQLCEQTGTALAAYLTAAGLA